MQSIAAAAGVERGQMNEGQVYRYVPYSGYPQHLVTAAGRPLTVVVDATRPGAFLRLWGMTLLERITRTVERLGEASIHLLVRPGDEQRARRRRFRGTSTPVVHVTDVDPVAALSELLPDGGEPVMLLEGDALYDRRLLAALWQHPTRVVVGVSGRGAEGGGTKPSRRAGAEDDEHSSGRASGQPLEAVAMVAEAGWLRDLPLSGHSSLREVYRESLSRTEVQRIDVDSLEQRVSLLRKTVPVRVLRVDSSQALERADAHLTELAGKGVNDLIGEFVHPPIEFRLTRLAAWSPVTPDQISYLIILLSVAGVWCFATGRLWEGIAVNLVRGVLDGVDGKLARLTLRESKRGNLLDHGTDTVYLPLLFLALGWGLSGGDPASPAAISTYLLQAFYWMNRILASWFKTFLGADESEFRPIDRMVRRIQPKRNIFIVILIVAMLAHAPAAGLYGITALTGLFMVYRIVRLNQEGLRRKAARRP